MIAFLVFFALTVIFIVGCVWVSIYLYSRSWARCLRGHQLVTLSQEAFIERRLRKPRGGRFDMGMDVCVRRVAGISLVAVAVIVVLIIALLKVPF